MKEKAYAVHYTAVKKQFGQTFTEEFERFVLLQQAEHRRLLTSWRLLDDGSVKFIFDEIVLEGEDDIDMDQEVIEQIRESRPACSALEAVCLQARSDQHVRSGR